MEQESLNMNEEHDENLSFMDRLLSRDPETMYLQRLAAENGDADAQNNLGTLFWMEQKWEDAARWYRKAALSGDASSQFEIGSLIYEGNIEGDLDEMVRCFFYASETCWLARFMMGECYRFGRGLAQSYEKAMIWFVMGELESISQERRLESCYAFFNAAPSEYVQAYAVDKRTPDMKRLVRKNSWKELAPEQLAEGLRRLTEYEVALL